MRRNRPRPTVTKDGLLYEVDKELPFTGKTVIQYSDGQKVQEFTYKDGKQHGKVTAWYENGQLKAEIFFQGWQARRASDLVA